MAKVRALADKHNAHRSSPVAGIEDEVIARIKKCLDRASHPGTPAAEAKAALHIVSRLLSQHNVTQAEVLAHVPVSQRIRYAGQSSVTIERADGEQHRVVRLQAYQSGVANAMGIFFDCKSYSTSGGLHYNPEWTFYGLAENTVAAALAFEMVINQAERWCTRYKGGYKTSYLLGLSHELTVMAENDAAAEAECARLAQEATVAARQQSEEAERRAQIDRLAPVLDDNPPGRSASTASTTDGYRYADNQDDYRDSDDIGSDYDDDIVEPDIKVEQDQYYDMDLTLDLEEEIRLLVKREPSPVDGNPRCPYSEPGPSIKSEPIPEAGTSFQQLPERESPHMMLSSDVDGRGDTAPIPVSTPLPVVFDYKLESEAPGKEFKWGSNMQLVQFRETARNIADSYLNEQGVKLTTRAASTARVRDWEAYRAGETDAKTIDVKRRRIQG